MKRRKKEKKGKHWKVSLDLICIVDAIVLPAMFTCESHKERGSDDGGRVGGHASHTNAFVFWIIKPFLVPA